MTINDAADCKRFAATGDEHYWKKCNSVQCRGAGQCMNMPCSQFGADGWDRLQWYRKSPCGNALSHCQRDPCCRQPSKEAPPRNARARRSLKRATERLRVHEALVVALTAVTKELREVVKDEKCDHDVGICWCETFRVLEQADFTLKMASKGE